MKKGPVLCRTVCCQLCGSVGLVQSVRGTVKKDASGYAADLFCVSCYSDFARSYITTQNAQMNQHKMRVLAPRGVYRL